MLAPVEFERIREVTWRMQEQISSGTIDAPSWDLIRSAKLASRMYAPLGTRMSLGDYIRLTRAFVEAFKASERPLGDGEANGRDEYTTEDFEIQRLRRDLKVISRPSVH